MTVGGCFDAKADRYCHFKMGFNSSGFEPDSIEVCVHTKKKASQAAQGNILTTDKRSSLHSFSSLQYLETEEPTNEHLAQKSMCVSFLKAKLC